MAMSRERQWNPLPPPFTGVVPYLSARSGAASQLLIDTGAIRDSFISFRTNHITFSNRHEFEVRQVRLSAAGSHASLGLAPSAQTGTASWTHPLVSYWKHSSRVEPARNFISVPRFSPIPEKQKSTRGATCCA